MDEDVNLNEPIDLVVFCDMSGPAAMAAEIERVAALRQFFPSDCWIEVAMIPAICEGGGGW